MRLFRSAIVVFVLLLPTAAYAQSVKLADLTGIWVGGLIRSPWQLSVGQEPSQNDTLIFRSDSTFMWTEGGAGKFRQWSRWKADTLSFFGAEGFKPTLKDKQLVLTPWGKFGTYVFKRADKPKRKL